MPSDNSTPLKIGCEAVEMNGPRLHFDVEFEFDEVPADHIAIWVRLRVENTTYETGRWFYWWNMGILQTH